MIKAIAVAGRTTPADAAVAVERLFIRLAEGLSAGDLQCLARLKTLQQAIIDREEQGASLSRLLPDGVADRLRAGGHGVGVTERLEVTVLMSDIRGYSAIAERTEPPAITGGVAVGSGVGLAVPGGRGAAAERRRALDRQTCATGLDKRAQDFYGRRSRNGCGFGPSGRKMPGRYAKPCLTATRAPSTPRQEWGTQVSRHCVWCRRSAPAPGLGVKP